MKGCYYNMHVLNYKLENCGKMCPEQYEVYNSKNELVGYLRLRLGIFRANYYPDGKIIGKKTVYEHTFDNPTKGVFTVFQRNVYLPRAIKALDDYINNSKGN